VSYSEQDGQVILTMSREDYDCLLMMLGIAQARALARTAPHNRVERTRMLDFVNRLNSGNPNYTPYQVEAEKKS